MGLYATACLAYPYEVYIRKIAWILALGCIAACGRIRYDSPGDSASTGGLDVFVAEGGPNIDSASGTTSDGGMMGAEGQDPADKVVVRTLTVASFSTVTDWQFNIAEVEGDLLRLGNGPGIDGDSAFNTTPLQLSPTVEFDVAFTIEGYGNDGIVFVLQSDPAGADAIGGPGGGMGYFNIEPSAGLEFDQFRNEDYDPNANHIALSLNGRLSNPLAIEEDPGFVLSDGTPTHVWIEYRGEEQSYAVFASKDESKPETPMFQASVDLHEHLGDSCLFGFTAARSRQNVTFFDLEQRDF